MSAEKPEIPNSLNEHWMPFTSNRDFKENPRLITDAKGKILKNSNELKTLLKNINWKKL